MIAATKQQSALIGVIILAGVAGIATMVNGLLWAPYRILSWIAVGSSVGVMILAGIAGWKARETAPHRPSTSDELSAHLLTIQEEERKKLSRDLHDGVGQTITALKMELARLRVADDRHADRLDRARALADATLRTIRDISLLLRPTALDDLGLEAALQWHAADFSRRTSVKCELSCSFADERSIPESVRTCVYRIIQEALNNCEKHAHASKVNIEVHQSSEGIAVVVTDDGRGIPPDSTTGLGILGMRERATMLGGHLELSSEAGTGTKVSLLLPCAMPYFSDRSPVA
jgi:signal transduction histidine kinase